jgi:hypothetical protein
VTYLDGSNASIIQGDVMTQKTCAACDSQLDEKAIKVTIGGKTVEVCCDECAQKLKDGHSSSRRA